MALRSDCPFPCDVHLMPSMLYPARTYQKVSCVLADWYCAAPTHSPKFDEKLIHAVLRFRRSLPIPGGNVRSRNHRSPKRSGSTNRLRMFDGPVTMTVNNGLKPAAECYHLHLMHLRLP